jgi:alanine racemase
MHRSVVMIDLGALRRNCLRLLDALAGAELWAVVKADGYGHGAVDCARAALAGGASVLCVATVPEGLEVRAAFREPRVLVMGPADEDDVRAARDARLELTVAADGRIPTGLPVHVKLDTGMARWGLSELPEPPAHAVGLMSHLATADNDADYAEVQIARFVDAVAPYRKNLTCHIANSAAALRLPAARLDAARCGIALYGLSPFGADPAEDGLEPVLSWRSHVAQVRRLAAGESTGYGRRFLASREAWIGIVPVGYADGFRRDLTGTEVLVGGERRQVVGTVSMDAFAVELADAVDAGTPVSIVGDGILLEEHARVAGTITYELASRLNSGPTRAERVVARA